MSKLNRIKNLLGDSYIYKRYLSVDCVKSFLASKKSKNEKLIASLTVGYVKINAVIYQTINSVVIAYDVLVKDKPESKEWVCYDTLTEPVKYESLNLEQEMFRVLDNEVKEYGLSYTECSFELLEGKYVKSVKQA